jgi:hypothetical protein
MLTRLKQALDRTATLRNTLLVFLSLLPFIFVFFRWRSSQLEAILGHPPRLFDTRVPYTPQEVHTLAGELGEAGRRLYAATEVTLDFAFPVLYASWLSLTLSLVWRKVRTGWAGQGWLPLLPTLGMLGDLTENVSIASLMMLFPGEPAWLAWFSNLGSLVKWGAGLASFAMILIGLGIKAYQSIHRQSNS